MSTADAAADAKLLLAEQHHRTRNLFQLTNAVLNNAVRTASADAVLPLSQVQAQLAAFGTLNEMLYTGGGEYADSLCCAKYLAAIVALLEASCLAPRGIGLAVTWPEKLPAAASTCRHLALIMTEIVFNAAKHAFPTQGGTITIVLERGERGPQLRVSDDGVGMDKTAQRVGASGRSFIDALARSMDASLELRTSSLGTTYRVKF